MDFDIQVGWEIHHVGKVTKWYLKKYLIQLTDASQGIYVYRFWGGWCTEKMYKAIYVYSGLGVPINPLHWPPSLHNSQPMVGLHWPHCGNCFGLVTSLSMVLYVCMIVLERLHWCCTWVLSAHCLPCWESHCMLRYDAGLADIWSVHCTETHRHPIPNMAHQRFILGGDVKWSRSIYNQILPFRKEPIATAKHVTLSVQKMWILSLSLPVSLLKRKIKCFG